MEAMKKDYQQLMKTVEKKIKNISQESLHGDLMGIQELVQKADELHAKADKSTDVILLDAEVYIHILYSHATNNFYILQKNAGSSCSHQIDDSAAWA